MLKAWTGEPVDHHGKFWNIKLPKLRPQSYTKPHPAIIRSCSGEESMVKEAAQGHPFMMNVQSLETTRQRFELYRKTLRAHGCDDAKVARLIDECWVWRNVFVAETDAEAGRIGVPLFKQMQEQRTAMRERVFREQGVRLQSTVPGPTAPAARTVVEHGLIYGSPATVAEQLAAIDAIGVGGLIATFRLGPMPYDVVANSLKLFAEKVIPALGVKKAA
jgi:alkanesulfonate monooxygenase SsuD/methylene tetrahydromethanopterin reductase-like flavin-dependent oxidoreductase (luciferase family)